jgi:hypothetical protein
MFGFIQGRYVYLLVKTEIEGVTPTGFSAYCFQIL